MAAEGGAVATGAVGGCGRSSFEASAEGWREPLRLRLLIRLLTPLSCFALRGELLFDVNSAVAQKITGQTHDLKEEHNVQCTLAYLGLFKPLAQSSFTLFNTRRLIQATHSSGLVKVA